MARKPWTEPYLPQEQAFITQWTQLAAMGDTNAANILAALNAGNLEIAQQAALDQSGLSGSAIEITKWLIGAFVLVFALIIFVKIYKKRRK